MKTKIAQGYNPDRVTVEELSLGYRLVPRRYLDRSKYDLTGVAQAWDGCEWDSDLRWADEDDSHRTLLSNAQLGMCEKRVGPATVVDVEANFATSIAAEFVHWRPLSEDERQIILKNQHRVDVEKFRHLGEKMYGLFGCPADHYTTTMSREEILDLKWRDITDAECKALRALHGTPRSLYNSRRFRHNATFFSGWNVGGCVFALSDPGSDLRYQTDLTPAELATLLEAKLVEPPANPWRKITEAERTKLMTWVTRPGFDRSAFDWTKFRLDGSDIHTGLGFAYRSMDYTTTLTPDELAKLVEPPVAWREITEDERVKLRSAREANHTEFDASVDWEKFKFKFKFRGNIPDRSLDFTAEPPGVYTTTLTQAEVEALVAKFAVWRPITEVELVILRANKDRVDWSKFRYDGLNIGKMNFGDPVRNYTTTMTPAEIEALAWRPITEAERLKLKAAADKSKFNWTKFRYIGGPCVELDFTDPAKHYTTTLTPDELAKLTEVWRPLSLAEVRLLQHVAQASRRAATLTPYDWRRFRCKFLSNPYHRFQVWDFGSSATDYQTTYTEQEIADMM